MVTQFFIWLGKTLATVAITVMVTLWLTGLIMTSVIQSVLEEYEIPLQVEPVIYSGVLGYLWGFQSEKEQNITDSALSKQIEQPVTPSATDLSDSTNEAEDKQDDILAPQEQPVVDVLAPIEMEEKLEISKNELGMTKESLTEQEKARLLQILVEKIPAEEWQKISQYMEEGLSETELLETQQILALHLNDEEYSEIMAILKKS